MKILSALLISAGIALTSPALADDDEPRNNGSPVSAFALRVAAGIALTSPALADDYKPPNNEHLSGTIGSGTGVSDCTYRGSERREGCI